MFGLLEFDVLAGDFGKGRAKIFGPEIRIQPGIGPERIVFVADITQCVIASEENYNKLSGRVGWGAAGALVFGPVGALAGLVMGGKNRDVNFIILLEDGRKLLAKADEKTYGKIQVEIFR